MYICVYIHIYNLLGNETTKNMLMNVLFKCCHYTNISNNNNNKEKENTNNNNNSSNNNNISNNNDNNSNIN